MMSSTLATSISDSIRYIDLGMQNPTTSNPEISDDESYDLLEEYPGLQGLIDQKQSVTFRRILEVLGIGYLGKEVTIHWGRLLTPLFSKDYVFGIQRVCFRNIHMEVRLYPYNKLVEIAHIILDAYHKLSASNHSSAASELEIICKNASNALKSAFDVVTEANRAAHSAIENDNIHQFNIQANIAYETARSLRNTVDDARNTYNDILKAVSVTKSTARAYIKWSIGRAHDNIEWSTIGNNAIAVVTANLVFERASEYIETINEYLYNMSRINSELNTIATSYILKKSFI